MSRMLLRTSLEREAERLAAVAGRAGGWIGFVDRLVPTALHRGDPIVRRRARVIVFNTAVMVSYGLVRAAIELAIEPLGEAWRGALPIALGCAGGVGLTVWLWRRGDTERAAKAGTWIVMAVAGWVTLAKSGLRSPGLSWFVVFPGLARGCARSRAGVA